MLLYWRLAHRPRLWLLLAGSYVFYAFWDVRFLALVFTTTVVDYLGGPGAGGNQEPIESAAAAGVGAVRLAAGLLLDGSGCENRSSAAADGAGGKRHFSDYLPCHLAPAAREGAAGVFCS